MARTNSRGLGLLLWGLVVGGSLLMSGPAPRAEAPVAPAPAAAVAVPVDPASPPALQEAVLDWDRGIQVDPDLNITLGNDPLFPYGVF